MALRGQLVEEHDLARHLVAGEVLLDPVLEVVLGDVARREHHERPEPLAEVVVVDADRGHLDDRLVAGEAVLDLLGEDVLAAGDDHLVVAALDVQPAVVAEPADVTGRHQSVDHLLVAAAGVALEQQRVADEDPTGLAVRQRLAVVVEDLHDRRVRRLAGGRRRLAQVARGGDRGVGDLGRAVDVVEVVAEVVHPVQRQVAGQRRAGGGHHLSRDRSNLSSVSSGSAQDPLQHHGDHDQRLALLVLRGAQALLGVELAAQHDRGAEQHREREVREAPRVEQRRRDVAAPAVPQRHAREQRHGGLDAGLVARRALGRAGGAGGEDDDPRVPVGRVEVGGGAGGDRAPRWCRGRGLLRSSLSVQATSRCSTSASASRPVNSSSWITTDGDSRSRTSTSWGPANAVLR